MAYKIVYKCLNTAFQHNLHFFPPRNEFQICKCDEFPYTFFKIAIYLLDGSLWFPPGMVLGVSPERALLAETSVTFSTIKSCLLLLTFFHCSSTFGYTTFLVASSRLVDCEVTV